MAQAVIMPKQGQSVEICIISEWFKEVGDEVKKGDVLFAYETDKASFEEEAPEDGVLLARFYDAGDEVPVLVNVCVLGAEGDDISEFKPEDSESDSAVEPVVEEKKVDKNEAKTEKTVEKQTVSEGTEDFTGISPRARKLAEREGVTAANLQGSGPEGRVIERDVKAVVAEKGKSTPLAKKLMKDDGLVADKGTGIGGRVTSRDLSAANVF